MTQLTTLTPDQVRTVLLGLAEHSSGTNADQARVDAVGAMADALTTPRPVDPTQKQPERVLVATSAQALAELERVRRAQEEFRDDITAPLNLPFGAPLEEITARLRGLLEIEREHVEARANAYAIHRALRDRLIGVLAEHGRLPNGISDDDALVAALDRALARAGGDR